MIILSNTDLKFLGRSNLHSYNYIVINILSVLPTHFKSGILHSVPIVFVINRVVKSEALAADLADPDLKHQAIVNGHRLEIVATDVGQNKIKSWKLFTR